MFRRFGQRRQEPAFDFQPGQHEPEQCEPLVLSSSMSREEMATAIARFADTSPENINVDDWFWLPAWRRRRQN